MLAALLIAQMVMPSDAKEERQFQAARTLVERAGWSEPAVFWHQADSFVLEGGRDLERHLLFVGGKPPVVVDLGKSEQLHQLSAEVAAIFPDVLDVVITKEPFRYESSVTQVTHDLISRGRVVCHIDGSARSSTAKGGVTWESRREVKLSADGDLLVVSATEERIERPSRGPGEERRTPGPSTTTRYRFPPGGTCVPADPR